MYIKFSKKIIYTFILFFVYVVLPIKSVFANSHEPLGSEGNNPPLGSGGNPVGSGGNPVGSGGNAVYLENPLSGNIDSLPELIKSLLNIVLIIGTPLVALAIIFAGFMLVAAQGNPEKLQKARQALLWAVVGGAVLLGSYVLAQAIGGTVEQLTN